MQDSKRLQIAIVVFTSITTFLLLANDTLFGVIRAAIAAVVLDGLILWWDKKGNALASKKQRDWAVGMKWAGVAMLLAIGVSYVVVAIAPVDATHTTDILGLKFTSTVREYIIMVAQALIGAWVVLTLGVTMYLDDIDPETQRKLKEVEDAHEQQKAYYEANRQKEREKIQTFRTACSAIARVSGTDAAFKVFRANLEKEGYKPVEIESLVNAAMVEVLTSRGEAIPVDLQTRAFASTVDAINPTLPSTRAK